MGGQAPSFYCICVFYMVKPLLLSLLGEARLNISECSPMPASLRPHLISPLMFCFYILLSMYMAERATGECYCISMRAGWGVKPAQLRSVQFKKTQVSVHSVNYPSLLFPQIIHEFNFTSLS